MSLEYFGEFVWRVFVRLLFLLVMLGLVYFGLVFLGVWSRSLEIEKRLPWLVLLVVVLQESIEFVLVCLFKSQRRWAELLFGSWK